GETVAEGAASAAPAAHAHTTRQRAKARRAGVLRKGMGTNEVGERGTARAFPPRVRGALVYLLSYAPRISTAISATCVGVRPTRTPRDSSASIFACAPPLEPDTMAPAWPIVLPGGAVTPA